jgi:3-hydroxypropanoate dehydrogenase
LSGNAVLVETLFENARTYSAFEDRPVPPELLHRVYDHLKWGPTSANACPARFVFVASAHGKARLIPCVNAGNVEKVRSAPVTAIIAGDSRFFDLMPKLFPARDFKAVFENDAVAVADLLARNVPLQGAYMIIAARALGLDAGPMSGFDAGRVNAEFFPDGRWQANFICNLGYGVKGSAHARNPRLDFAEACAII